jgi:hypothetical protein
MGTITSTHPTTAPGYIRSQGGNVSDTDKVLDAMKKASEPLNAGSIAELSGLDRKVVDKAMIELKKDGRIESPVRCKWVPAS